jgi:hypothetical protein
MPLVDTIPMTEPAERQQPVDIIAMTKPAETQQPVDIAMTEPAKRWQPVDITMTEPSGAISQTFFDIEARSLTADLPSANSRKPPPRQPACQPPAHLLASSVCVPRQPACLPPAHLLRPPSVSLVPASIFLQDRMKAAMGFSVHEARAVVTSVIMEA